MKTSELILGGSLLIHGCAQPPEYFEDLSQGQYNDAEQALVEVDNIMPFVAESMRMSPVPLVDAHGRTHDDQNAQAIKDLELGVDNAWDSLTEGRTFTYDKNRKEAKDSKKDEGAADGVNYQNLGQGIDNDYVGIDFRLFNDYREIEYSPGRLRESLVHEGLHSEALLADKHGDVIENPEKYYDPKDIDMLALSIQEGDPTYQDGQLIFLHYCVFYGEINMLYHNRNSAFQEYYEDPWSPENPDSWNDPQRVYNRVASGKKDKDQLREEIRGSAEKSPLFEVLKISEVDRERLLKKWFSSENWENFLEDYEHHYQFILNEIANEFEDHEIMTLEERVVREEMAAKAREARERQVTDMDGYRAPINTRRLR